MPDVRVRFLDLPAQYATIADEVRAAVDEVFATQAFILGPAVARFEAALARYLGAGAVVGVASGTDALYVALRDRKRTRLNSSHCTVSRMPSSA